jgi:hypothetical protein
VVSWHVNSQVTNKGLPSINRTFVAILNIAIWAAKLQQPDFESDAR